MLKRLSIRNFVLIDETEIRFSAGLNILSGETGGGKSVIAAAVGLFAGGRARPDYVRKGSDRAVIEGEFEIGAGKNGFVLVSREFDRGGRSRCRFNGEAVGTARLREEVGRLLCITSQHEQVSLTSADVHRGMLDDFGGITEALEDYRSAFGRWREAKARLAGLRKTLAERESRIDYIKHQLGEIKMVNPRPGEDREIRSRLEAIKNCGRISEVLKLFAAEIFEGEGCAATKVAKVSREIDRVASAMDELAESGRILSEVQALLGELERVARNAMEKLDFDERSVDSMQERLYDIERLKKKYGGGIEEILRSRKKMEEEEAFLENLDSDLRQEEEKAGRLERLSVEAAEKISRMRKKAAAAFRRAVMKELMDLAFKNVDFEVDVRSRKEIAGSGDPAAWLDETGGDEVEFLLKPNEGEDFAPLRRIASGGELSRVPLALKVAVRSGGKGETFIFDEIDSGIGGSEADAVGRSLHRLGKYNQVLCITHLPQIAAYGDRHMLVGKRVSGGRTLTYVRDLEGKERIDELARMLGGERITKKGREAALEMLSNAEKYKSGK